MSTQTSSRGQMLKIGQVVAETSLSRRTIYRLIGQGQFPRSRKLSPQRVAWSAEEIDAWKRGCPINAGGPSGGPKSRET
jgi:prophage regulatory protein